MRLPSRGGRAWVNHRAWARCRGTGSFGSPPGGQWHTCLHPPAGLPHLDDVPALGLELLGSAALLLLADLLQAHACARAMFLA